MITNFDVLQVLGPSSLRDTQEPYIRHWEPLSSGVRELGQDGTDFGTLLRNAGGTYGSTQKTVVSAGEQYARLNITL